MVDLAPIIKELQEAGKTSLRAIAAGLNEAGIPTARGGEWSSPQVMRILERLDPFRSEEQAAAQTEVNCNTNSGENEMPLTPDPSKAIEIDRFVAVRFAMFDGKKRVSCRARWAALQDRAALDQTDQNDVRGTFEKYRAEIEKVASDRYDRGELNPLVESGEF